MKGYFIGRGSYGMTTQSLVILALFQLSSSVSLGALDPINYLAFLCKGEKIPALESTDPVSAHIQDYVSQVTTPEALADFFQSIGEIGVANRPTVESMANMFYQEFGKEKVQSIVKNLLMSHRHLASQSVFDALLTHSRREDSGAQSLVQYFPKAIDEKTFLKWVNLGQGMSSHENFTKALNVAVSDFKSFQQTYRERIDQQQTYAMVLESLKGLHNPSLIGEFIELFTQADRLTRQYIIDQLTEVQPSGDEIIVQLKKTDSNKRISATEPIDKILRKSLDDLQERAYFNYTAGVSTRPELPGPETTKPVALRVLGRKKHNLTDYDVQYIADVLVLHPYPDREVNAALTKLLESGSGMAEWKHKHFDVYYALFELEVLARNAAGLSTINVDLKYSRSLLSNKTDALLYLANLVKLHARVNLERFPVLKDLAVEYFRRYPDSFNELSRFHQDYVQKFKNDFNL